MSNKVWIRSSEAAEKPDAILEEARAGRIVELTADGHVEAVVLPVARYQHLQAIVQKHGTDALFEASGSDLGAAAVAVAAHR